MPNLKPSDIAAKVEAHDVQTEDLRQRMEDDYSLYQLDRFDAGNDYEAYTSNEPRNSANKIISWLASAERVFRVPVDNDPRQEREQGNAKERFIIGCLNAADERQALLLRPPIADQLSWFTTLRGWTAGRVLLPKSPDGGTTVDITPWDMLLTYWQVGRDGLLWACYKMRKTSAEIEAEYGVTMDKVANEADRETGIEVFDYYDDEINTVVTADRVLKKPSRHGSPRVPVFIVPVGVSPPIQTRQESGSDTIADYGESIYDSNRDIYETNNLNMSILKEMVSRSRKPPLGVRSRTGDKTLEQDPYKAGAQVSLAEGDNIAPLEMMQVAKETAAYMSLVSGEIQRGTLPYSVYGELQFQLSGFAINTLRQGIETIIRPRMKTMETAYLQIGRLLVDQYVTGAFEAFEVRGEGRNRKWFSEEITPEQVKEGGEIQVRLIANLPQDDMTKMGMAQMAREGPVPLYPDIWIRDNIMGDQDVDEIDDAIKEQLAERTLPEAGLWTLLVASENRGRPDLAMFYYGELMKILVSKGMVPSTAPPPGQNGQVPVNGGGGPPGVAPQVMPQSMMGVPPPQPVPQAGPLVPPGQPRPGAVTDQARLNQIGLFGPGG